MSIMLIGDNYFEVFFTRFMIYFYPFGTTATLPMLYYVLWYFCDIHFNEEMGYYNLIDGEKYLDI